MIWKIISYKSLLVRLLPVCCVRIHKKENSKINFGYNFFNDIFSISNMININFLCNFLRNYIWILFSKLYKVSRQCPLRFLILYLTIAKTYSRQKYVDTYQENTSYKHKKIYLPRIWIEIFTLREAKEEYLSYFFFVTKVFIFFFSYFFPCNITS